MAPVLENFKDAWNPPGSKFDIGLMKQAIALFVVSCQE